MCRAVCSRTMVLYENEERACSPSISLPCEDILRKRPSKTRKKVLTRYPISCYPDLGLLQKGEKIHFCFLSYSVNGVLLWQLNQTKTRSLRSSNLVKMVHHQCGSPYKMRRDAKTDGHRGKMKQRYTGKKPCEHGGRDWSVPATDPETRGWKRRGRLHPQKFQREYDDTNALSLDFQIPGL